MCVFAQWMYWFVFIVLPRIASQEEIFHSTDGVQNNAKASARTHVYEDDRERKNRTPNTTETAKHRNYREMNEMNGKR